MPETPLIPVAEYLRMSTDQQEYSIAYQKVALTEYALAHHMQIVQTYIDSGCSGLRLKNRKALRQLLNDVIQRPKFRAIIVYDVSRWGRFQDPDEAAHYEFLCRQNGIPIHYCAEQFQNDQTISSSIIKALKRSMAAEYSRELSVKVYSAQRRAAEAGYWVGSSAVFGFRRMLISPDGKPKHVLQDREAKCLRNDHVALVLGPPEEIEVVRLIYRLLLDEGLRPKEIVRELSRRGITCKGKPWSFNGVKHVLTDPKYCGMQVWGTTESKLKSAPKPVPKERWVIASTRGPSIVDEDTFQRAQQLYYDRTDRKTNEELLRILWRLWQKAGFLTEALVELSRLTPSVSTYCRRFGSITRAFQLIGYRPPPSRIQKTIQSSRRSSSKIRNLVIHTITAMFSGEVTAGSRYGLIRLPEDNIEVAVSVARADMTQKYPLSHKAIWHVSSRREHANCITLLCLLDKSNQSVRSFYVFPRLRLKKWTRIHEGSELLSSAKKLRSLGEFCAAVRTAHLQLPPSQSQYRPAILVGVPEISRYLGRSLALVQRLIRHGLPTFRTKRFIAAMPDLVDEWVRENGTEWRSCRDRLGRFVKSTS